MLQEALTYLVGLGRSTCEVHKIALPGNRVLVVKPNGECEEMERDRTVRSDRVRSIADLTDWVAWLGASGLEVECFVQPALVTLAISREDVITDRAEVALTHSVEWMAVQQLLKGPVSQKDFLKLLRGPLARAIKPSMVSIFRSITFRSTSTTDRGASTLGRSVESAVASANGDIPEHLDLEVAVFDPAIASLSTATLTLCIDTNFEAERFEIYPLGDTLGVALTGAISEIRGLLTAGLPEKSMVVLGTYNDVKAR
jgi:hypothetical protein